MRLTVFERTRINPQQRTQSASLDRSIGGKRLTGAYMASPTITHRTDRPQVFDFSWALDLFHMPRSRREDPRHSAHFDTSGARTIAPQTNAPRRSRLPREIERTWLGKHGQLALYDRACTLDALGRLADPPLVKLAHDRACAIEREPTIELVLRRGTPVETRLGLIGECTSTKMDDYPTDPHTDPAGPRMALRADWIRRDCGADW
ncbi:unnamed protein product [Rhizoctonia solani]|uniref:Uncharacterized protein n=1 Tax=Rhizoctonia solani TaxID=456999 RepID=A0A8H3HTM3_9AGAM|nr:unnamed protein product [Rhizoctonia solani]